MPPVFHSTRGRLAHYTHRLLQEWTTSPANVSYFPSAATVPLVITSANYKERGGHIHISNSNNVKSTQCASSSNLPAWDGALRHFYSLLSQLPRITHSQALIIEVQMSSITAMRSCVANNRLGEALDVYLAASSSGVGGASLEALALEVLQHIPHHTQQSLTVSRLLAAESDHDILGTAYASQTGHLSSLQSFFSFDLELSFLTAHAFPYTRMSAAEEFRILLKQRTTLLRAVSLLSLPLGRDYLLSQVRTVAESAELQAQCEVDPLVLLSSSLLEHPFAFKEPSVSWARRECLLGELDTPGYCCTAVLGGFGKGLSAAQMEGLSQIEESVASVRQLRPSTLFFLATFAPNWDAVFLKRVAEVLVLPTSAHAIFPVHYTATRRRHSRSRRQVSLSLGSADAEKSSSLPLCPWTDITSEMFGPPATCSSPAEAERRVEAIVKRRLKHDLIVPDAHFLLFRFHQLRQMGKHREIVVTHGVLLEVIAIATQSCSPQRFHARRILRELMCYTTSAATVGREECFISDHCGTVADRRRGARHLYSVPSTVRALSGGITLLGLQDELVLLEPSPERFIIRPPCSMVPQSQPNDGCASAATLSAVLVSKQLERLIAAHDRAEPFNSAFTTESSVDSLVAGILQHSCHDASPELSHERHNQRRSYQQQWPCQLKETPLFQTRTRAFWAHLPVLLATTSNATRRLAYMVGLNMYPPVNGE